MNEAFVVSSDSTLRLESRHGRGAQLPYWLRALGGGVPDVVLGAFGAVA